MYDLEWPLSEIQGHWFYEGKLEAMDLPSLAYRRLRGDAIEVYKYLKVDSSSMLPLAEDVWDKRTLFKDPEKIGQNWEQISSVFVSLICGTVFRIMWFYHRHWTFLREKSTVIGGICDTLHVSDCLLMIGFELWMRLWSVNRSTMAYSNRDSNMMMMIKYPRKWRNTALSWLRSDAM